MEATTLTVQCGVCSLVYDVPWTPPLPDGPIRTDGFCTRCNAYRTSYAPPVAPGVADAAVIAAAAEDEAQDEAQADGGGDVAQADGGVYAPQAVPNPNPPRPMLDSYGNPTLDVADEGGGYAAPAVGDGFDVTGNPIVE